MLFYLSALLIVVIDQFLKYLVVKFMYLGQSLPVLNDAVKITYVRNTGAAFSLFVGFSPYLAFVGLVVAVAVIYFHYRPPTANLTLQIGLSCLLGGSIGNLLDRIVRSYVVDYLDITIWPVFNFADIMINIGVFFIVFNSLKSPPEQKEEGKDVSGTV